MFGWDSFATDLASPMNRRTKSSSLARSACMTLSATSRSSRVSVARETVAIPPRAMRAVTAYRPSSRRPVRGSARVSSIATILRMFCLSGVLIIGSPVARGGSRRSLRQLPRPVRPSCNLSVMTESGRVVVAGAGLAGFRTVEELRERGFPAPITVTGADPRPPYDRPPLSKKFMAEPGLDPSLKADFAALDVDFRLDEAATELGGELVTSRGAYPFDHLGLATGSLPVALPGDGRQRFLRPYDDALALRDLLRSGPRRKPLRPALVGAGWIGAELATAAVAHGSQVTVVEAGPAPLASAIRAPVGAQTARWYAEAGGDLRVATAVEAVRPGGAG